MSMHGADGVSDAGQADDTDDQFWPESRFFGPSMMRKPDEIQIQTPVGKPCFLCAEAIVDGDIGTINGGNQITHYECMLRTVIGSIGHLQERCSCFGGTEEDPPGQTFRQAAVAAVQYWHDNGRPIVIAPR